MELLHQLLTTIPILVFLYHLVHFFFFLSTSSLSETHKNLPKSYPIIGTFLAASANKHRRQQWFTELVQNSPTATFVVRHINGPDHVITGNPAAVEHILRSNFPNYVKGPAFRLPLADFLGDGIFATSGDSWKFQRQVASREFSTRSLRRFVETAVDSELHSRLLPILQSSAAAPEVTGSAAAVVLDLQDVLQRFAFDNICKIAFGYDPAYLLPSLPESSFAAAFDDATALCGQRSAALVPAVWRIKRFFNIGSERRLAEAVAEVRDFAAAVVRNKKENLSGDYFSDEDLLSRFLISGHTDERFTVDIVISFILAGRDTTSAALTWFFWFLWKNPRVEAEILKEINGGSGAAADGYDEAKEMVYTQAALCESMRLYPPVPSDSKEAAEDDVLPDGTAVRKGQRVLYLPYAMGRLEAIWGKDWPEFRPERWLKKAAGGEKWVFVPRDPYAYPVFQAGPRICLGKDMAFLQMKRLVAGVLPRFRIVPVAEPIFVAHLTSRMKDGFPVRVEARYGNSLS